MAQVNLLEIRLLETGFWVSGLPDSDPSGQKLVSISMKEVFKFQDFVLKIETCLELIFYNKNIHWHCA